MLSGVQVESFKKDGYLLLEKFFSDKDVEEMLEGTIEAEQRPEKIGCVWKYFSMQAHENKSGEHYLDRIENFADKIPSWSKHIGDNSKIAELVSQLFGQPAKLWKEKINFKKPGSEGFLPHQDAQAGWLESGQTFHISAAVSIDDTTVENGCIEIVKGKHLNGLIGPVRANMSDEVVQSLTWEDVPTKKTDLLIFGSFVPHRSKANSTSIQRRVMLSTYAMESQFHFETRDKYYENKLKFAPPALYKDESKEYRGYLI